MSEDLIIKAVKAAARYLFNKPDTLQPLLIQYPDSINSTKQNLNVHTIRRYIEKGRGEAVLVFF